MKLPHEQQLLNDVAEAFEEEQTLILHVENVLNHLVCDAPVEQLIVKLTQLGLHATIKHCEETEREHELG